MYKIMQKYNKKLLAIVMVFLMIAFVIPQFSRQRTPNDVVYGTAGDDKITAEDVRNARYLWEVLKGGEASEKNAVPGVLFQTFDQQTGQPAVRPLAEALGPQAFNEIQNHPVMFLLLQKEAQKRGVTVAERDLEAQLGDIQVRLPDRTVLYDNVRGKEEGDEVREAVKAFALISNSFTQAASAVKISQPLLQNRMARELQEVKLNLVEFHNKDYSDKVSPATPEQISEQFNKYGDELAGRGDPKTNPFGFGYKYPNRIKLSYIAISRDEVKKAVRESQGNTPEDRDYYWTKEAYKYYTKHASLFATTEPSTEPSTAPSPTTSFTLGATSKPSKSAPTTKPFEAVRSEAIDMVITPQAEALEQKIQSRLSSQMREDYNAYHAAMTKTPAPTTAPASALGVPYDSADYLSKLGAQIQSQFKVVPTIVTLGDKFRSEDELKDLPGIGKTMAIFGRQPIPFAAYAVELAAPFMKNASAETLPPIQPLEPSRPLEDIESNTTYIFRLTDTEAAHKPADSRDVLQKVEEDLRTQAAYNLAKADAEKLLDAAKGGSLSTAAISAGKKVQTPDYISSRGTLPGDIASPLSQQTFLDDSFSLLSMAASNKPAIKLIGLPRDYKIFVAQLADVRRIPEYTGQIIEPQIAHILVGELSRNLYQQWYRYDSLAQRMNYTDANKKSSSEG